MAIKHLLDIQAIQPEAHSRGTTGSGILFPSVRNSEGFRGLEDNS